MYENIHIITTGGTIDVAQIKEDGSYTFAESGIPKMLKQGGINIPYEFTHLPPINSLFMEDDYREDILQSCLAVPEKRILITHGTDTMVEMAKYLHGKVIGKTIMLVGAMIPANKPETDAYMNLGFAIGALLSYTQTGIRIVMNGQVFLPYSVRKNKEVSPHRFESV